MQISQITRRDIFDIIRKNKVIWYGRLDAIKFLERLYDLESMPSYDLRHPNMKGDIIRHTIANPGDWNEYWVFEDDRLALSTCTDKQFLNFLSELLHPIVRPDQKEVSKLLSLFNECIKNDGYELVEVNRISGKPIFKGQLIGLSTNYVIDIVKKSLIIIDTEYLTKQIKRIDNSMDNDPSLAIGTAKELIETCCKSILYDLNIDIEKNIKLNKLVKLTVKNLKLLPEDISDSAKGAKIIKTLLSNLTTIASNLAELRNLYGTGHGKKAKTKGIQPRHAKLATCSAITLAVFLVETYKKREKTIQKQ